MIIFFFFYFFNELYNIGDIQEAFKNICLNKMLSDGYFDMSPYIFGRFKKDSVYAQLTSIKSKYAVLYKYSYPKQEKAFDFWEEKIGVSYHSESINLTVVESSAIVNWVYRILKDSNEREDFTKSLFAQLKELHSIEHSVRFSRGIVYNSEKVDIHFLSSVSSVNKFIADIKENTQNLFYRGHSNSNYILKPSIMRTTRLIENESKLYNELLINCPDQFVNCTTHIEKLVKMQHYGLPTRLLDITRNPLVALYFACINNKESSGELILITTDESKIKYPQSDTVSLVSSLATFTYKKQCQFKSFAQDSSLSKIEFNKKIARLTHEVRLEKPAFQQEVIKEDLLDNYIVLASKSNNRMIKQDGAFILCGLDVEGSSLERFRYHENEKKVVLIIDNKDSIIKELDNFSINRASLFPEIECVSEYLKEKYS